MLPWFLFVVLLFAPGVRAGEIVTILPEPSQSMIGDVPGRVPGPLEFAADLRTCRASRAPSRCTALVYAEFVAWGSVEKADTMYRLLLLEQNDARFNHIAFDMRKPVRMLEDIHALLRSISTLRRERLLEK